MTNKERAVVYSGIFAILFIATISFERICMESRYTQLKELSMRREYDYQIMKNMIKTIDLGIENIEDIGQKE